MEGGDETNKGSLHGWTGILMEDSYFFAGAVRQLLLKKSVRLGGEVDENVELVEERDTSPPAKVVSVAEILFQ